MTNNVARLYDHLHATEKRFRQLQGYPIHKVLKFEQSGLSDIYQWIANIHPLPEQGNILDAGCGVGWGSRFLAASTQASVTGISISQSEIETAKAANLHSAQTNLPDFHLCSFDNLEPAKYDFIVAVESIKHSLDLDKTLKGLTNSLKPGGNLVIIEDVFCGEPSSLTSKLQCDWHLHKLYTEQDFRNGLAGHQIAIQDLTDWMPRKPAWLTQFKLCFLDLTLIVSARHVGLQAFRGGFCLDRLYQQKGMRYCALTVCKSGQENP